MRATIVEERLREREKERVRERERQRGREKERENETESVPERETGKVVQIFIGLRERERDKASPISKREESSTHEFVFIFGYVIPVM